MDVTGLEHFLDFKEKDWKNYIKIIPQDIEKSETQKELEKVLNDKELSSSIYFHLQNKSIEWLYKNIPALNDKKPIDFIGSKKTMRILKGMLMRM